MEAKLDSAFMQMAIDLARSVEGLTRPNPPVGAVVVDKYGRLAGQGAHIRAGLPHAEVVAITEAGKRAMGGTLYVSLEPCCTFGRTPPCTDLIIRSRLKRVVIATSDPNPKHSYSGIAILKKHGIEVTTGVMKKEADELIAPFARWIIHKLPFLIIKLAITCDGKIADFKGQSKWITGKQARIDVHNLRRTCDAIIVGAGTAIADDPLLLPSPRLNRKPYRVIVDANGRVPATLKLLNDRFASQTIIATTSRAPIRRIKEWERRRAMVLVLKSYSHNQKNRVALFELLAELAKMNVLKALCEGGGELAASFVKEKLANSLRLYVAPKILGDSPFSAFRNFAWQLDGAPALILKEEKKFGNDVMLSFDIPELK